MHANENGRSDPDELEEWTPEQLAEIRADYEEWLTKRNAPTKRAEAAEARITELKEAAQTLVAAVDEMIADPQFKSLFIQLHVHGGSYRGRQIGSELEALRAVLKAD